MKLKWILYKFLLRLFGLLKIKNNKILFCSYHGNSYSGNPRYIAEALKKKDENLDIVWLASKPLDLPTGMRCVKVKSISALYEYATSKIWIDDSRSCIFDAVIANVPSIIYASDIDDFTEHERGLFFSWDELPFAITRNNNELNSAIEEINVHDYLIKASNFMERCGFIKNEHASADVADYILNVISGSINCYGK